MLTGKDEARRRGWRAYLSRAMAAFVATVAALLVASSTLFAATAPPKQVNYLWSIPSASGSLTGRNDHHLTLRLVGVRDYLTRFTDRPVRRAYVVVNVDFVRRFKRYFADAKPNAVLSFTQPGHRIPTDIVLQIGQPRWHPKTSTLTFPAVRILKREDNLPDTTVHIKPPLIANPRHFGRASLFIDSAGPAVVSSHLYWSSDIGGTIVEANLDGSNPTTIVTGQNSPVGVAVGGNHLYWANEGTAAKNYTDGTIVEANLDGTNQIPIATGLDSPFMVAVDSDHLYWTSFFGGKIIEANLDGTNQVPIVTGLGNPEGVAVDCCHLYWANNGSTIIEANLDGTNPVTIADGQANPGGLALGPSHLYWANGGTPTVAGSIVEGRGVGGSPPTPIVTPIATGQNVTGPLGVAVDSSHLYWANQSGLGNIIEANLDGTNPLTIATNQNGPSGVAVGP
jgi:hypothetical protein